MIPLNLCISIISDLYVRNWVETNSSTALRYLEPKSPVLGEIN
jgi:hypothetical protein